MNNISFKNMDFRAVVEKYIKDNGGNPNDSRNLSPLIGAFSDKLLIPNWFNKYHYAAINNIELEEISDDQWEAIVEFYHNHTQLFNWMSDELKDWHINLSEEIEMILED